MPMPRNPVTPVYRPSHNRLPSAANTIWYPLHGNGNQGLNGLPTLSKIVQAGSVNGSEWTGVQWGYTYPVDNGGATDQVCWRGLDDDANNYLDATLGLSSMASGQQIIMAMELQFIDQISGNGSLMSFGKQSAVSFYSIYLTVGEVPTWVSRARNASAQITAVPLAPVSGKTFIDMKGQGQFFCVIEIKPTSTSLVDLTIWVGHKTLGNGSYTATGIDILQAGVSGTKPPGLDGQSAATFGGLTLGGLLGGAGTYSNHWGRGAGNTARQGNFQAHRYTDYNSARAAAVLANLLARPGDLAESFLTA